MTRRLVLGVSVTAAATLAAAIVVPSLTGLAQRKDVPVAEVKRLPFRRLVTAEGNLRAVKATPLTTPSEARGPLKIAWLLPDGSRVHAGEVVVRFDPTDKEKEVADGKADREAADRRIAKKGAEDGASLRNLDRDAEHARRELDNARTFESKDPEIFSRVEIIESQLDAKLAGQRAEHATENRKSREALASTDRDLLGIERRKADLKVRQGEEALLALEVVSPHDGILIYQRDWRGNMPRVGDSVWSGQPLAEIPELDAMEAEVFVLEADAGGVREGLPATVVLDAQPSATYAAKVKRVDRLARPRFDGTPMQYFSLTLEIERTDPAAMKPGQRLHADLSMDERESALSVPREALFEKDGKKIVYRARRGGFDPVGVALGPSALGRIVVEKGLEEGDEVALRDPTRPAEAGPAEKEGSAPPAPPAPGGGP